MASIKDELVLSPLSPKQPYDSKVKFPQEKKGQRKLLITELRALTLWWNSKTTPFPTVVYVGASPSVHTPLLSAMFPQITFHLYDPRPFDIKATEKIHLFTGEKDGFFTDETAKKYSGRNDIIFISDIRTLEYKAGVILPENEKIVAANMADQKRWVQIINPVFSLLKFRLPYVIPGSPQYTEYLEGTIMLQPHVKGSSSETRLLVTNSTSSFKYNNKEYEDMIFAHNMKRMRNPLWNDQADQYILREYLRRFGSDTEQNYRELNRVITNVVG